MFLDRCLTRDDHIHQFRVESALHGWEVMEEHDAVVVRSVHRRSWERVETDGLVFDVHARELERAGWQER